MRSILVFACACGAAAPAPIQPAVDPLRVPTDRGVVVGHDREGVREFLGIPFAQAARWQPPTAAAPWGTRVADARGPACPQLDTGGFVRAQAEDCLSINVWSPPGDGKPVLAWIHGGAFYQGSGGDDIYDGARLAKRTGAIVVTFNYRVGPLGFLAHRELGAASVGLLDQRAALQWVQRNIAGFGGDPKHVTIFGESAGAWSACAQLAMPGSRGLFAGAIMESGACSDALYFSRDAALAQGDAFAAALDCRDAACLRAQPLDKILHALPMKRGLILTPGIWWGPVIDGRELPRMPLAAIRDGSAARVPMIVGSNHDEGVLHTLSFEHISDDEAASFVRDVWGEPAVAPVMARYHDADPKHALDAIINDGIFACSARRIARSHRAPVYLYEFTHALDEPKAHALGATHSVELWFVFGNPAGGIALSARERELSDAIMDAWGRFARTGDPGWPAYTSARDAHQVLDLERSMTGARIDCDFWDGLR